MTDQLVTTNHPPQEQWISFAGDLMTASTPGFEFLIRDGQRPFHPSGCFIVADPAIRDPRAWSLELERPAKAAWVHPINDMKSWMLHGEKAERQIFYKPSDPKTPFRVIERTEVFREYVRKILELMPSDRREGRKLALMPAIGDEKARKRYKEALEAAIPGVTVVPEPEMVAEYFRLVQQTLELEKGENNVLLVIDVGASTANMTLILSRRDETILEIDTKGAQRDLRVRALRGDSAMYAGRWIDRRLAEVLAVPEAVIDADEDHVLRAIEEAKVRCSASGKPSPVPLPSTGKPFVIDSALLTKQAKLLWRELVPLFQKLCERLYENQTSSEDAKRRSEPRFKARRVKGPRDASRLIDTVLVAGGTSLLPGFERAMLDALFATDHKPNVLRVGAAFPIAAAAGGLAHVLQTYEPPRLRAPESPAGTALNGRFEGSLPYPLVLGVKRGADREHQSVVLDPDDPFVDDGGRRPIDGMPTLAKGAQPRMRLIPGGDSGVAARRGRTFQALRVLESPGKMELEWDPIQQRGSIRSDQVEDASSTLWIDVNALRVRKEDARQTFTGTAPAGSLVADGAEDVVLDLGMSKIVAVSAVPGWVSASWLEEVVRDGVQSPHRDANVAKDLPAANVVRDAGTSRDDETAPGSADGDDARGATAAPSKLAAPEPAIMQPLTGSLTASLAADAVGSRNAPALAPPWTGIVSDQEFTRSLQSLREEAARTGINLRMDDVTVALLALAVRPIVLLAGPPGCGKSTLVRVIAHLLGKRAGTTFHEVAVQAHWENDECLFGTDGVLRGLTDHSNESHLILFDEVNLTRPEYFLSRFFYALEGGAGRLSHDRKLPPCRAFGTLNIDDTSRPPSPKVADRCFLLELTQVGWNDGDPPEVGGFDMLPQLAGLPALSNTGHGTDERISAVLAAIAQAVAEHDLRHDLLPSRRVLADTRALLALHHSLDLEATGLLRRDDLVDRILSSRILVKLTGAFEQIQPALEAASRAVEGMEELVRTRRRLKLAHQQARLGFVSPWQ